MSEKYLEVKRLEHTLCDYALACHIDNREQLQSMIDLMAIELIKMGHNLHNDQSEDDYSEYLQRLLQNDNDAKIKFAD